MSAVWTSQSSRRRLVPAAGVSRHPRLCHDQFGREHFQGVTVQPMISFGGYEVIWVQPRSAIWTGDPVRDWRTACGSVQRSRSGLPPLNTTLARQAHRATKIYQRSKGVRGRAGDLTLSENYLVRFSQLVVDQPLIKEIDINPLLASPSGFVALDARVIVHDQSTREEDLPKLAIRPYPIQYVKSWLTNDNIVVTSAPSVLRMSTAC